MAQAEPRLRLTELLASLSLATDLGTGQPLGHGLRTCLLAVRLASEMGHGADEVRSVLQVALLRFLGCTADSAETAVMAGGDDLSFNFAMAPVFNGGSGEQASRFVKAIGPGQPKVKRAVMIARAFADPGGTARGLAAHCEVAALLAQRLGVEECVGGALRHAYERWDGKGYPVGIEGEAVSFEIRIATVAGDADLHHSRGQDAVDLMKRRRGRAYDPNVVDAFLGLRDWNQEAEWEKVLEAEPAPVSLVRDLDTALSVLADFVDLKSPWTRGHSRSVAQLAEAAAIESGLSDPDGLRRAALVHDLGRAGVENGVWDKTGPLSLDEKEKVRLHPYLTNRILSRCPALSQMGELASNHHERMDGSGYHRQVDAGNLSSAARILAAADVMAALTSNRPHREASDLEGASATMRNEAKGGRLDRRSVESVIAAAGGTPEHQPIPNPGGLTDREVDVLKLVAGGMTNRQVGQELFISVKTVGRHVENIYAKVGVSTRAGAAVFAMEHRLLS